MGDLGLKRFGLGLELGVRRVEVNWRDERVELRLDSGLEKVGAVKNRGGHESWG